MWPSHLEKESLPHQEIGTASSIEHGKQIKKINQYDKYLTEPGEVTWQKMEGR